ncbi:MAG: sulfite exporter TauE/SafE family protein [Clostridia bacterium]|nr:sulfite exporter TauE/SafE family protein [Clostridia bacterium]
MIILGVFLLLDGTVLLRNVSSRSVANPRKKERVCRFLLVLQVVLLAGFFGSGGGLIILPALVKFLKVDEYKARGTTLATILVATLITAIFYANFKYFDLSLSIKAAIGGVVGGTIGAKVMKKISKEILNIAFDIFLIVMSVRMIFWS